MGILSTLAAIPTASNLALKLKDADAEIKVLKEKNTSLQAENERLAKEVAALNAQANVLTSRIAALESPGKLEALQSAMGISQPKQREW